MEQIVLNFDAKGFDAFQTCREYFADATVSLKDEQGRRVYQNRIAMELDFSPSQFSQKLHESNNTTITLNDAERYTDAFGDVRWIHYLVYKHILKKKRNREELAQGEAKPCRADRIQSEISRVVRESLQSHQPAILWRESPLFWIERSRHCRARRGGHVHHADAHLAHHQPKERIERWKHAKPLE